MNIEEYKKRLPDVITHEHLSTQLDLTDKRLDIIEDLLPRYAQMWKDNTRAKSGALNTCKYIHRSLSIDNKGDDFGDGLHRNLEIVMENMKSIRKHMDQLVVDVVVTKGISLRQAGVLINVEAAFYFAEYGMNVIIHSIKSFLSAVAKTDKAAYATYKAERHRIKDGAVAFISCYNLLGEKPKLFTEALLAPTPAVINNANAAILHNDLDANVQGVLANRTKSDFNQNPIMWIRSTFIGLFEESYSELDSQRRFLELSLIQLENEKNQKSSPAILKEMEIVEDRIVTIKYKMKKIMGDIDK